MGHERKHMLLILGDIAGENHASLMPLNIILHNNTILERIPSAKTRGGWLAKVSRKIKGKTNNVQRQGLRGRQEVKWGEDADREDNLKIIKDRDDPKAPEVQQHVED